VALTPVYLFVTLPWRKNKFQSVAAFESSGRFGHPWFWDFGGDTTVEKSCKELATLVLTFAIKKKLKNKQRSSFVPGITS
jgi:hypothetical protein